MSLLDDFKRFIADAESGSQYAKWAHDNPGEVTRWHTFRDAILAGSRPGVPAMTSDHGRELIDAGVLYLDATAPAPAPAPTPTPAPLGIADEFRLGDPAKGFDASSTTSTGWTRQAGVPAHVAFNGETWYGSYPAVDLLVQPADPAVAGMSGQRAQVIHGTDGKLLPGVGRWLSVAFETNPGYRPQAKTANPNWNILGLCLHEPNDFYAYPSPSVKTTTPQAPFNVTLCTTDPNTYPAVPLAQPRFGFMVYGGTPSAQWYSQGRRFLGPVFQPGHRYVLDLYYLEASDPAKGQLEVWLDGVQVVPRTNCATTWKNLAGQDATLYMALQNYRPAGSEITWDNLVTVCGARIADTRQAASFLT